MINLQWSISKRYLTPQKACAIFKHVFCGKYTLVYAVIMCFIIIVQVQSKNNKQWNTVANSIEEQFECDQCFSVDFEILMQNPLICKPYQQWNEVNILILIFTVPSNFLKRKVIRETWLTPSYNNTGQVRHAFLIGTTNDGILTSQVKLEDAEFGDIIQFNFYESYRNLTLKTLMGFKWATEFCSNAHFIMKTDDDVYVNINGLFRTLLIHGSSLKTSVAGLCELGSLRDTNPSSKWYVSPREYPYRRYHWICHGFGYITSMHTLHNIFKVYVNIPYIYLEDVYIGFCVKRLGYNLLNIEGFFREGDIEYSPCNLKHPKTVLGHHVSLQQMEVAWNTPCDKDAVHI
jgi:hypothetical protein